MHAIFRTFRGAYTGDMNNIMLNSVTTRERLEKVIRSYIPSKYQKSPSFDVPKIDEIIVEYRPGEEVYPYVVFYLTHEDAEPHIVGSIDVPFYDQKEDITTKFPSKDIFYQKIALGKYREAFTDTLAGELLFWSMRYNRGRNQGTCISSVFEYLDDQDVWELHRVIREYPKLMCRCD